MSTTTNIYKWTVLTPFVNTADIIDADVNRFTSIEAELYSIFSIFGNGILDDNPAVPQWQIIAGSTTPPLSINITLGHGFISYMSAVTTATQTLQLQLPTTGTFPFRYWIYATTTKNTPVNQEVRFVASTSQILDVVNYVGLGAVDINFIPGYGYTLTPYNDADHGRVNISLYSIIATAINKHLHIGGINNPSKINLQYHVQGKLSKENLQYLDLDLVTAGTLNPNRLPVQNHDGLEDIGTLKHSEIDSFLSNIAKLSGFELTNLVTNNEIKLYLAILRASIALSNPTPFGFEQVSDNLILYIPGISTFIDNFAADLTSLGAQAADIDTVNHQIVGTNNNTGSLSNNITYTNDVDFTHVINTTSTILNTDINNLSIQMYNSPGINTSLGLTIPLLYQGVPNTNTSSINHIVDMTVNGNWLAGTLLSDNSSINSTQGFLDNLNLTRYLYTSFGPFDWSQTQKIAFSFQLGSNSIPGRIEAFLILQSGVGANVNVVLKGASTATALSISDTVTIYDASLYTTTPTTPLYSQHGLSEFFVDIPVSNLSNILGIGFRWKTTNGWNDLITTEFLLVSPPGVIDDEIRNANTTNLVLTNKLVTAHQNDTTSPAVFIWNSTYYATEQRVFFRFDSNYNSTVFNSITKNVTNFTGASISFFARIADDISVLNSLGYTAIDNTGHIYSVGNANVGRYIDIVADFSSPNKNGTPLLNSLTLTYSNPAQTNSSKIWDTSYTPLTPPLGEPGQTGWYSASSMTNISVVPDGNNAYIQLSDSSKVGQFIYAQNGSLYVGVGQSGGSAVSEGSLLYVSPIQTWNNNGDIGFSGIKDVLALSNGNYIISDSDNDRVVEIDKNYNLVRAIQGNLRARATNDTNAPFRILGAYYNPRIATMWIAFSQNVSSVADLTKIFIGTVGGSTSIPFNATGVTVTYFNPNKLTTATYPTYQVVFSGDVLSQINNWVGVKVVIFQPGSVTQDTSSAFPVTTSTGVDAPTYSTTQISTEIPVGPNNVATMPDNLVGLYDIVLSDTDNLFIGTAYYSNGLVMNSTSPTITYGGYQIDATHTANVNVIEGEIVFADIYQPLSIQLTTDNVLVIASVGGDNTINAFDINSNLLWSVPSTLATYTRGGNGSAWYDGDKSGLLTVGLSDIIGDGNGQVIQYNRIAGNIVVNNIKIPNGNAVRAIPDNNNFGRFWVLVDDIKNNGNYSSLLNINSVGNVVQRWPQASDGINLIHPTTLRILNNGQLVISD